MKQSDKTQLRVLAMEAALRLSSENKTTTASAVVANAETILSFIATEDGESPVKQVAQQDPQSPQDPQEVLNA